MTDTLATRLQDALGSNFTLERELGGAGMSRVFVASERALNRRVVVKVLPPDLAAGVNKDRFRTEIQLAAQLQHPHIVPLLTAGEQGDLLWFTMPFIEGESLRAVIDRRGRLPAREVLRLLHDVVDALSYAHTRGVVHRDIKPGNILMSGAHAMVTDFGVAKALSAAIPAKGHTTSGMAIGTPAYMAPEQLAADPSADHRVDLYAVGLLAYELLTGASPFRGHSPQATLAAQLTERPTAPHLARADVPTPLSEVIMRCLEKDASKRPDSAADLLEALDEASGQMSGERAAASSGPPRRALFVLGGIAAVALAAFAAAQLGGGAAGSTAPDSVLVAAVPETVVVFKDVPVGRDAAEGVPFDVVLAPSESLALLDEAGGADRVGQDLDRDSLIAAISKLFADSMAQALSRMETALENQPQQRELQQLIEGSVESARAIGDSVRFAFGLDIRGDDRPRPGRPPRPPGDAPPDSGARASTVPRGFFPPRTAADSARLRALRSTGNRLEVLTPVMAPPPPGTRRLAVLPLRDRSSSAEYDGFREALLDSVADQLRSMRGSRRRLEIITPEATARALGDRRAGPISVGFMLRANYVLSGDFFVRRDSAVLVTVVTDVQGGEGTRYFRSAAPLTEAATVQGAAAQWVRERLDSLRRAEPRQPRERNR